MELVAVDVGGTNARFAIAEVADGRVRTIREPVRLPTADHDGLTSAWNAAARQFGRPMPRAAAIALASPIDGDFLHLTNNPWVVRPSLLGEQLGVDCCTLVNDFAAIGHAVAQLDETHFAHLCGPETPFPRRNAITVCGPGTGLGVAQVIFRSESQYQIVATEGGHVGFSPIDGLEDALLKRLRRAHGRVSLERIVSGPGLVTIYETLARIEGRSMESRDDRAVWDLALSGRDDLANTALNRFCMALGSAAGDFALAHGPTAVVIGGGLGYRMRDRLPQSGFAQRFVAKGRFKSMMEAIPVKLIAYPEPGLYGAAAAFAREHARGT